jgi:Sugar-transfer associated ATP-grasp
MHRYPPFVSLRAVVLDSKNKHTPQLEDCKALSCVFRAGRAGAATDHDSILFDVDVETGLIRGGTTNAHWYKLGLGAMWTCPWRSRDDEYRAHPDGNIPVSGNYVPDIQNMLHLAERAHYDMCPLVPMAGWDVVLSADSKLPMCLLEVNLSCNFFR